MTYTSHSGISQSILDLTFATSNIAENIVDWTINDEIVTRSDHEVIAFNLLSKNAPKVDNSLNASYNVQKADLKIFYQKSAIESRIYEIKNVDVNSSFKYERYEKKDYFIAFND